MNIGRETETVIAVPKQMPKIERWPIAQPQTVPVPASPRSP